MLVINTFKNYQEVHVKTEQTDDLLSSKPLFLHYACVFGAQGSATLNSWTKCQLSSRVFVFLFFSFFIEIHQFKNQYQSQLTNLNKVCSLHMALNAGHTNMQHHDTCESVFLIILATTNKSITVINWVDSALFTLQKIVGTAWIKMACSSKQEVWLG